MRGKIVLEYLYSHAHKHIPVVDNAKGGHEGKECECVRRAVCNTGRRVSLTDMPGKRKAMQTQTNAQTTTASTNKMFCCNIAATLHFPPYMHDDDIFTGKVFVHRIVLLCSEN